MGILKKIFDQKEKLKQERLNKAKQIVESKKQELNKINEENKVYAERAALEEKIKEERSRLNKVKFNRLYSLMEKIKNNTGKDKKYELNNNKIKILPNKNVFKIKQKNIFFKK